RSVTRITSKSKRTLQFCLGFEPWRFARAASHWLHLSGSSLIHRGYNARIDAGTLGRSADAGGGRRNGVLRLDISAVGTERPPALLVEPGVGSLVAGEWRPHPRWSRA